MRASRATLPAVSLLVAVGTVFVLDGVVERLSVLVGRRVQDSIDTDVRNYQVTLENVPETVANAVDAGYLLVRFGSNEQLAQNPSQAEKAKMKLRNEEFDVEQRYDSMDRTLTLSVPLRTHRRLTSEFKLFVDVEDSQHLEETKRTLESDAVCADVSEAAPANSQRLYVVLDALETTTTPEGITNNLAYPK